MNDLVIADNIRRFGDETIFCANSPRWRSMETAPLDGSYFLGFVPYCIGWNDISGAGPIRICCWVEGEKHFTDLGGYSISDKILYWSAFPVPPSDSQLTLLDGGTMQPIDEMAEIAE